MKRVHHKALLLLALVAAVAYPIHSQPQQRNEDEPLKLSTQLVVVDAQVLSKNTGIPVNGLSERDFVLYEEGVKQQITHFSQDKLPLSIVLLLDVSGSVMPVIDQVRDSGLRALNELKPGDEVALMAYTHFVRSGYAAPGAIRCRLQHHVPTSHEVGMRRQARRCRLQHHVPTSHEVGIAPRRGADGLCSAGQKSTEEHET